MPSSNSYLARRHIRELLDGGMTRVAIAKAAGIERKTIQRLMLGEYHATTPETLAALRSVRLPRYDVWRPIRLRCGKCLRWRPCSCKGGRMVRARARRVPAPPTLYRSGG